MEDDVTEKTKIIYTPGMLIENPAQSGTVDYGSIGCFAKTRANETVLLSCAHVLFGDMTLMTKVKIYSPPSGSTCCRHSHIATTLGTWQGGFDPPVTVIADDEPTNPYEGYETDCAIAELEPDINYSNEIPKIGMISGTPPDGSSGVVERPAWGTKPSDEHVVRFYSQGSRKVNYGVILKPTATGSYVSGAARVPLDPLVWPKPALDKSTDAARNALPNIGQFMVMPCPAPTESLDDYLETNDDGKKFQRRGRKLTFGAGGDSGSVVVNYKNQVIGLLCRANPNFKPPLNEYDKYDEWIAVSGVGFLNPIRKVLKLLNIEIPPNLAATTLSAGTVYFDFGRPGAEEMAEERGRQRAAEALRQSRLGRLLLGKIEQHRLEARRIVQGHRQAMVIWQRNQGPAFVKHCLDNLRDPKRMIPTSINGVAREQMLRAMAGVLLRYGSDKLRRDIERYRAYALQQAAQIMSFDQVGPVIEEVRRHQLCRTARRGSGTR
jgi:hypothetical protein